MNSTIQESVTPPSYPARPINGGPLPKAQPKHGDWRYEPKYNGWRALVHVPTGAMFNRELKRLSIAREFSPALAALRANAWLAAVEWVDTEALERRHGIGRGTLILLDYISRWPRGQSSASTYLQRRFQLELCGFPIHDQLNQRVPENTVMVVASYPGRNREEFASGEHQFRLWDILRQCNAALGCQFYEGLVAKRADSTYPLQLRSPDVEFPFWMKHRWRW